MWTRSLLRASLLQSLVSLISLGFKWGQEMRALVAGKRWAWSPHPGTCVCGEWGPCTVHAHMPMTGPGESGVELEEGEKVASQSVVNWGGGLF